MANVGCSAIVGHMSGEAVFMEYCASNFDSKQRSRSLEMLAVCVEAVGPERSSLIHSTHRFVSRVPWHFNLIVLNDVLLDNGVAGAERRGLLDGARVEVSLRDEAVVAWNMRCGLGCADCQLVVLVGLRLGLLRQFRSWVMSVGAERFLELSVEVATLRRVSLAIITPQRALRYSHWCGHLLLVGHLRVALPVGG